MVKGSYAMIVSLKNDTKLVIRRKHFELVRGYYLYIGSALNGIEKRIERHFRKGKKIHWHIDALTENGEILEVYYIVSGKRIECEVAAKINLPVVEGFGNSDCKCSGHLFYSEKLEKIKKEAVKALSNFGEVRRFERYN